MKVVSDTLTPIAEQALYEQMVLGSEKAYYDLFERFWEPLYTIAARLVKDREIAKDIVQEIFLSLWEKRATSSIQNIEAYLHRAAKFGALKEIRDNRASQHDALELAGELATTDDHHRDAKELQHQISAAIEELPERCKEVFLLSREEQLSNREIAEQLNLSQRTVETHISNALKHLRNKLPGEIPLLVLISMFYQV